jgi:metallothionein
MTSKQGKKCAHPNCSCLVSGSESYCSAQCESTAKTPDIDCKCGHPGCKGRTT